MVSIRDTLPLIAIVGPTASGKTAAAIELAQLINGEIICADSRTVYREMNVGTAKPDADEQAAAKHWGLDLVRPDEKFSVAQFQAYAEQKITEMRQRKRIPIVVGGSGLYVDSVIFHYSFSNEEVISAHQLQEFEGMSLERLIDYCNDNNILLPRDTRNKRRVIGAIRRGNRVETETRISKKNVIVVGISTKKEVLHRRIETRAATIFENGVIDEAIDLANRYGWQHESMTGNIYALVRRHLKGEFDENDLIKNFIQSDIKLAKRQMTWFRRNPNTEWCMHDDVVDYTVKLLDAEQKT